MQPFLTGTIFGTLCLLFPEHTLSIIGTFIIAAILIAITTYGRYMRQLHRLNKIVYLILSDKLEAYLETIIQKKMPILEKLPVGIMITKTEVKAGSTCTAHQLLHIEEWLKHHRMIKFPSEIKDIFGDRGY